MLIPVILYLSSILYIIILLIFGGRYSFAMQEIKSLSKILKLEHAKKDKVRAKIEVYTKNIPKNKKWGYIAACGLLGIQFIGNSLLMDDGTLYIVSCVSFAFCLVAFAVVYWLKGSGTIDDDPRMHGGMRI